MSFISGSGGGYAKAPPGPAPALPSKTPTPTGGFALVNGTPDIISAQVPNDGQLHPFIITGLLVVTVTEVGGSIACFWTLNGVGQALASVDPGNGNHVPGQFITPFSSVADPGTNIAVRQFAALTSGAASWFGQITVL